MQLALVLRLLPIFEADFNEGSFGYRPGRNAHQALDAIARNLLAGRHEIIDADLSDDFGTIPHAGLLRLVARRVSDGSILGLVKRFLKAPIVEDTDGKRRISPNDHGTPQGGNLSPLMANLYLNSLNHGVNGQNELDAQLVRDTDDFELLTSRPKAALSPAQWLQANIGHWGIETGLHARLDASRHDDCCRLRRRKAVRVHGMFNRWANSLFMHWRTRAHHPTTDFTAAMAENHDRRALSAVLARRFPS